MQIRGIQPIQRYRPDDVSFNLGLRFRLNSLEFERSFSPSVFQSSSRSKTKSRRCDPDLMIRCFPAHSIGNCESPRVPIPVPYPCHIYPRSPVPDSRFPSRDNEPSDWGCDEDDALFLATATATATLTGQQGGCTERNSL